MNNNTNQPARSAQEQFDRQAAHYNTQWSAWSEESLRRLLELADCRPEDIALDVATGTGFTALAFAPFVRSVIGLDVSPGMLAQARLRAAEQNRANVTFQEGAAENLPFPDSHFDLVTCRIAPHHFLSVPRFLAETARVLKPGGRLLLADTCVPDNDQETDLWQNRVEALRDPSHVRNYSPSEWSASIYEAGLHLEHLSSSTTPQHAAQTDLPAELQGIPITLNDWIHKAGCTPEQAEQVRHAFQTAPDATVRAFRIEPLPGGDFHFVWQRVIVKAVKTGPLPA